ncbi:ribosome-releasing factor 2, mitochondrial isoform X2 [Belonocnema kinseyi]|uniref:ribosome-releasing factor 2, mitochondrial isoform X2 n=1 Tax=Belonocnema kinseyi TaxID=2817044 RepID=UPI00143E0562|nr:ribosome-releasing factor 2, mitochondrial isoform X2 [Belonocnema kinseyi]
MLKLILLKRISCKWSKRKFHWTSSVAKSTNEKYEIGRIRNIGIFAHIDAGKTTTTERMLFYSGTISSMGEVHHGNTVTDYMEQERERGITITSAAVTFSWKNYKFNLIDTPGHIDFTNEVEQTLGILDGAIVVLDGSAGVEAQTMTVWNQANRYNIPRIVYINKMDRKDADFEKSLQSIESKLDTHPLPIQLPLKDDKSLIGLVNVITLEKILFNKNSQGTKIEKSKLTQQEENLYMLAKEKRTTLTDKLSGLDDELANVVIQRNSLEEVSDQNLVDSLRRVTISRKAVPVLLGSSYKNVGVQPLMDGIALYLPSPGISPCATQYSCFEDSLCAKAFKIIHDKQRGPMTFVRVFTGKMKKSQKLYNIQQGKSEQSSRIYAAYADEYVEVQEMDCGNITAITGLKCTAPGDLVTCSSSSANRAKTKMRKNKNVKPEEVDNFFSRGARVPDPVFFCSIEPPSLSYQVALDNALQELQRQDPSLRVAQDDETGQIVLGGMGELHIEIIKEIIKKDYKVDVQLGKMRIAYKETIDKLLKDTYVLDHKIGTSKHTVKITLSVIPIHKGQENLIFDQDKECASNLSKIHPRVLSALKNGVSAALMHGPKLGCPVIDVGIMLHWLEVGKGTSDTMVCAAMAQGIRKLFTSGGSSLLEPIMKVEIVATDESAPAVLADISRRRAAIKNVDVRRKNKGRSLKWWFNWKGNSCPNSIGRIDRIFNCVEDNYVWKWCFYDGI